MKIASTAYRALIALLAALTIIGCGEDYDPDYTPSLVGNYIRVSRTSFTFDAAGDTLTTGLQTYGNTWQLRDVPDWLKVTPATGKSHALQTITIVAEENESASAREAEFYITSSNAEWDGSRAITVKQNGATPYATVDVDKKLALSYDSQDIKINVSTNVEQNLSVRFRNSKDYFIQWGDFTYDEDAKTILLTLTQNDSGATRTGYLRISGGGKDLCTIEIEQASSKFTIDGSSNGSSSYITLKFDADGGPQTVKISSDEAWSAKLRDDSNSDWLEFTPAAGVAGETVVTIQTSQFHYPDLGSFSFSRSAYIDFYIGTNLRNYIWVTQAGS